jgi:uncharacterized protein (TIGR02996 family)
MSKQTLLATVDDAARVPIGVAWKAEGGYLALAVREGASVFAGVTRGDDPSSCGWAELSDSWLPELERNFARLQNWARTPGLLELARPEKKRPIDAEEAGLLAAIAAAPDDEAPRLVYADWLTQRDDPRGELIALQCELEHLEPGNPERVRLTARALRIAEARPPIAGKLRHEQIGWRRGFVGTLMRISPQRLLGLAPEFARQPVLEELVLELDGEVPAGLAQHPAFPNLRQLSLLGRGSPATLLRTAPMPRLRWIGGNWGTGDALGEALLANPSLPAGLKVTLPADASSELAKKLRKRGWTIARR